jgi:hypothetical protein
VEAEAGHLEFVVIASLNMKWPGFSHGFCDSPAQQTVGTCCASTVARHDDDLADEQLFGLDPRVETLDKCVVKAARCAQAIEGVTGFYNILAGCRWGRRRRT